MSGWVVPGQEAKVQLPPGIVVASMGRRVGAWILDGIFGGLLTFVPVLIVIIAGAVRLNQQALDQIGRGFDQIGNSTSDPFRGATAPLLNVDSGLLVLAAVLAVGVQALYYIGSWWKLGGAPAQRMLSLRVADFETGNNLSLAQATLRWIALSGLSTIVGAIMAILVVQAISTVPTNDWLGQGAYYSGSNPYRSASGVSNIVSGVGSLWLIVLIITAGTNSDKRGLHDRLAGSLVVGEAPLIQSSVPWGYPPVAPYGYPQSGPVGPVYPYPPQAGPYPPAYPGAWVPPVASAGAPPAPPAAPPAPDDRQSNP